MTRGVRNLQLSELPATQTAPLAPVPLPMLHARRPTQTWARQQQQEYLRCAHCGPVPAAFKGAIQDQRCLMLHHGSEARAARVLCDTMSSSSRRVAQRHHLDRAVCVTV